MGKKQKQKRPLIAARERGGAMENHVGFSHSKRTQYIFLPFLSQVPAQEGTSCLVALGTKEPTPPKGRCLPSPSESG